MSSRRGILLAGLTAVISTVSWSGTALECADPFVGAEGGKLGSAMETDYLPDGREWEDVSRLSAGTLPPRAVFGSFPDVESARQVLSEFSPRTISLDSETDWRFCWSRRPSERPQGFERPDYDVSAWPIVKVPCSWQAMGIRASGERFGTPIYVNQHYIFTPPFPANTNCAPRVTGNPVPADWTFAAEDNPVGSYRRQFTVPADWAGDRILLRFDGVESFFYVWVNGHCRGFAKDSRAVTEFDVTEVVRPGANTLAVEVYRNSDGSYLECQDVFRLSGIHRSVYLTHVPETHLHDVSVRTTAVGADWELTVGAKVEGGSPVKLRAVLFGPDGTRVLPVAGGEFDEDGRTRMLFRNPRLWSAEKPDLYTLVVSLEQGHRVIEAAGFDVGFRESRIAGAAGSKDRVCLFNGQPIKLKGVNRGETDPMYGHHVPVARLEQDLRLIKQGNFNFIRNSHFPQPERFYHLANRLGLYVMDEANIETHGLRFGAESLSHDPRWREAHLARVRSMYERSKNQPCVAFWSLGNEAGPGDNFKACADWLRERDRTRPVHYERNNEVADMGSCFYPTLELAGDIAAAKDSVRLDGRPVRYPFLFVEYAHNLNNNCGNLADFQRIIESDPRVLGGALWDFADQALWKRLPDGTKVAAWGGCFGEKPEEGQGMMDGIVTTDRRPEPGYFEAKHVFQPFAASLTADRRLLIENKHDFTDLAEYDFRYTVLTGGVSAVEGAIEISLAPHERKILALPTDARRFVEGSCDEVALRVSLVQRKASLALPSGFVVAEEQLQLKRRVPSGSEDPLAVSDADGPVPRIADAVDGFSVTCGTLDWFFSAATGELVSLKRNAGELLFAPMSLDAFRAPVGGETLLDPVGMPSFGRQRLMDGLRVMRPSLRRLEKHADGSSVIVETEIAYRGARQEDAPGWGHGDRTEIEDWGPLPEDAPVVVARTRWSFERGGRVRLRTDFAAEGRPVELQRLGWRLVWVVPRTEVEYFACGPRDNYRDRKDGCFAAVYREFSDRFAFAYGCSQDGGNREEARYVSLLALGLRFSAVEEGGFAFSVSPYSPTELLGENHPENLPCPVKTELGLYAKVRGLGSGNCGPGPKSEDLLKSSMVYSLAIEISER